MKKGFLFGLGILFAGVTLAAIVNGTDIPEKAEGDRVSHVEFNALVGALDSVFNSETASEVRIEGKTLSLTKVDDTGGNITAAGTIVSGDIQAETVTTSGDITAAGQVCDSNGCIGENTADASITRCRLIVKDLNATPKETPWATKDNGPQTLNPSQRQISHYHTGNTNRKQRHNHSFTTSRATDFLATYISYIGIECE